MKIRDCLKTSTVWEFIIPLNPKKKRENGSEETMRNKDQFQYFLLFVSFLSQKNTESINSIIDITPKTRKIII